MLEDQSTIKTGFSAIGDVHLQVSGPALPLGRSLSSWQEVARFGRLCLHATQPDAGWAGFPSLSGNTGPWSWQLLGELYGTDDPAAAVCSVLDGSCREISTLNGHFALLAWNDEENLFHVWTDRFGTVHLYHGDFPNCGVVGTCLQSVAAAGSRKDLDWEALCGFFSAGFFPADRTHYADIRILRPASHYIFDASARQLRQERYWDWSYAPDASRSLDDTVHEFGELFHRVMDNLTVDGRVAVPISGGLDSRSTVAALMNIPGRLADGYFWSYSYGYTDDSVETAISRQIAAAAKLPFRGYTIGSYLFDRIAGAQRCLEGFQDITQARQAFVADDLRVNSEYVIAAHWGDVWLDTLLDGSPDQPGAGIPAFDKKFLKGGRGWLLDHLCRPHVGQANPERVARDLFEREYQPYASLGDGEFALKAFKTDQWSFRWTLASLRMFQSAVFPRLPFYDTRLADFFATVPAEYLAGRRLQIEYIKRFAPELARIRWQVYDADLYRFRHFHTWQLPRRAWKKAFRVLSHRKVVERNWEVQFFAGDGRQRLEESLLKKGVQLHELVSPGEVKCLLDDFYADPHAGSQGYVVSMLLTLADWLERYA